MPHQQRNHILYRMNHYLPKKKKGCCWWSFLLFWNTLFGTRVLLQYTHRLKENKSNYWGLEPLIWSRRAPQVGGECCPMAPQHRHFPLDKLAPDKQIFHGCYLKVAPRGLLLAMNETGSITWKRHGSFHVLEKDTTPSSQRTASRSLLFYTHGRRCHRSRPRDSWFPTILPFFFYQAILPFSLFCGFPF